jgi:shikimate dehydrogenase
VQQGADITIVNRSFETATRLADNISHVFDCKVKALALNDDNLAGVLKQSEILVNTTSVGMSPQVEETPVGRDLLRKSLVVYDIVYNPVKTRLLKEAEAAGAETIGGLDMLVWQGALAFKLWTGQDAPVDLMKKEALKLLGKA